MPTNVKPQELNYDKYATGLTTKTILKCTKKSNAVVIDFSKQMLRGAKKNLNKYPIKFINADYSLIELPENNEVIVSVISIHY